MLGMVAYQNAQMVWMILLWAVLIVSCLATVDHETFVAHHHHNKNAQQRRLRSPQSSSWSSTSSLFGDVTVDPTAGTVPVEEERRTKSSNSSPSSCNLKLDYTNQQLLVDDQVWLTLGQKKCVRRDGQEVCPKFPATNSTTTGTDRLGGEYHEYCEYMNVGNSDRQWKVSYRTYDQDATTLLFRQTFLDDFNQTNVPAPDTLQAAQHGMASWFPSFQQHLNYNDSSSSSANGRSSLGYLEFNGKFVGAEFHRVGTLDDLQVNDALSSGPMAIFNQECVLVLSVASSFMSTSSMYRPKLQEFGFGVMGSITSIPENYEMSVIVSSHPRIGPTGIRDAFTSWGSKLQTLHQTNRMKDVTLDYLQYSTDNGAYYYYHADENKTYQDTILQLQDHVENKIKLPVKSWLLDSWFYYKGKDQGVKEWVARPDVFPDGLAKFRQQLNWLTMAHNRYWSTETVYAKQNGGDFDFVMEDKGALPLEEAFWDYIFGEAKKWGIDVYEQDWLNIQTQSLNWTLQTIHGAENWLLQMGRAAQRHNIPIQYCMSWPRHILQSLRIDAVTQARASDDVLPDNEKSMQLGVTSMVAFALGLAPHKDSFWSTPMEPPRNPYPQYEHASKLLSIISTYSTGPVAPSDYKEFLNVNLIMKSCTQDGTILKPDVPAVRTDTTLLAQAKLPVASGQRYQVWSTRTTLSGYSWTYIVAANSTAFDLTLDDIYPSTSKTGGHVAWALDQDMTTSLSSHSQPSSALKILPFPDTPVPVSNRTNCHIYGIAPIFHDNSWAFLGEALTKWTAVSKNRFSNLQVDLEGFSIEIEGAPKETVHLWLNSPSEGPVPVTCQLSSAGTAVFSSMRMHCYDLQKIQKEMEVPMS
eukprot:scaffold1248_cov170-Amphora_coffeaeformis.AAC.22